MLTFLFMPYRKIQMNKQKVLQMKYEKQLLLDWLSVETDKDTILMIRNQIARLTEGISKLE